MRRVVIVKHPSGRQEGWLMPERTSQKRAEGFGKRVHPWPDSVFVVEVAEVAEAELAGIAS